MRTFSFRLPLLAALIVSLPLATGWARSLGVLNSAPGADATVSAQNSQYVIRFNGWVDHGLSRLEITRDGAAIAQLIPTGDSEPDVLAASGARLTAGHYELHWRAKSVPDNVWSEGRIPFSVSP